MICRRNSNFCKLLGSVFITFVLIYLWSIYQDPSSQKKPIVIVTPQNEAFNESFEMEEAEEDYEEETIVLWDEFNHLDVNMNKDIFLIESSGLVWEMVLW